MALLPFLSRKPKSPNSVVDVKIDHLQYTLAGFADPEQQRKLLKTLTWTAQMTWVGAVSGQVLPGMTRPVTSSRYAKTVADPKNVTYFGTEKAVIDASSFDGAARIENGFGSFDMKKGLLASAKVKSTKPRKDRAGNPKPQGRYVDIPFRHATPETPAKGLVFASTLPPEVYEAVKYNPELRRITMTQLQQVGHAAPRVKPKVGPMTADYQHKAALYEGLHPRGSRGAAYGNARRYLTFRRVSTSSDPNSWVMPAQEPNPVIQSVVRRLDQEMPQLLDAYITALVAEMKTLVTQP
jgi:hypothetical protein